MRVEQRIARGGRQLRHVAQRPVAGLAARRSCGRRCGECPRSRLRPCQRSALGLAMPPKLQRDLLRSARLERMHAERGHPQPRQGAVVQQMIDLDRGQWPIRRVAHRSGQRTGGAGERGRDGSVAAPVPIRQGERGVAGYRAQLPLGDGQEGAVPGQEPPAAVDLPVSVVGDRRANGIVRVDVCGPAFRISRVAVRAALHFADGGFEAGKLAGRLGGHVAANGDGGGAGCCQSRGEGCDPTDQVSATHRWVSCWCHAGRLDA